MTPQWKTEASRIRLLRNSANMTQAVLAEKLNTEAETIKRYEKNGLPKRETAHNARLQQLASVFKVVPEYILGVTDEKDPVVYYRNLQEQRERVQEVREYEEASYEALCTFQSEEKARIAHYSCLFDMCGFVYEYIGDAASFDFQTVVSTEKQYAGPHKITDKDKTFAPLYLSENELSELISKLQSCIALECFHIRRGRENGNG